MHVLNNVKLSKHYTVVEKAIRYIEANQLVKLELDDLARALVMSSIHFQQVIEQWAGVSPKLLLQYLTLTDAKRRLMLQNDVFNVAPVVDLSRTSRLHDLMVTCVVMTPAEVKALGAGWLVKYGYGPTPYGEALIAWTDQGVCCLAFATDQQIDASTHVPHELTSEWPHAVFELNNMTALNLLDQIFNLASKISLHLKGTPFQIQVWQALIHTQPGDIMSYQQLAQHIHHPKASRAVGSALAANKMAYLIPCHRVIKESGHVGQYRWLTTRKVAMLSREAVVRI